MRPDTLPALRGLFLCCLVLAALACSRDGADSQSTVGEAESGRVPVIRLQGGDWGYPTPFAHYPRGPGGYKMCLIFDSLLERGESGLVPWLAEKWAVREGGSVYIFTIRQGVEWHDGTPLTPADVAFSLDYAARRPMTWSYVFGQIRETGVLPGNRVRVTLKQPCATMLENLGRTRIIPRHVWENQDNPQAFTGPASVVGTGPFRLTGYSREHGTYRFEAFDRFWGPRPRVGRIEFVPVSEPILAYENGEIDLVRVSPDILPRFGNDPAHKVVKGPAFWGYRLLFNLSGPGPMRDRRVRQAFAHAIDLEELVAKIARGAAKAGRAGILPPDHVMAADGVKTYEFSPEKAATLLADAGFRLTGNVRPRTGPDGEPLAFDLLCSGREVRMAEIIKQRLGAVGADIRILSKDGKTRDSRVREGRFSLAIIGHGGWGNDPDYLAAHCTNNFFRSASPSASGVTGPASPALTGLLVEQRLETDPDKRRELIREIQHLAAEAVPEIPLFYTTAHTVYRPATYDGWMFMFDHHSLEHSKLSYLDRKSLDRKGGK